VPRELIPIVLFNICGLVAIAFSPIGRAIARRIGGGKAEESEVAELRADVADLRAELDARLGHVDELQERLDFAERALTQIKSREALPGAH
jgi:ubiquinone biosynthesis protein UbiJ